LQHRLLTDLHQFAVPRHARWYPLGLLAVRSALQERLGALGPVFTPRQGSGQARPIECRVICLRNTSYVKREAPISYGLLRSSTVQAVLHTGPHATPQVVISKVTQFGRSSERRKLTTSAPSSAAS
jgi:hypothetical protein